MLKVNVKNCLNVRKILRDLPRPKEWDLCYFGETSQTLEFKVNNIKVTYSYENDTLRFIDGDTEIKLFLGIFSGHFFRKKFRQVRKSDWNIAFKEAKSRLGL